MNKFNYIILCGLALCMASCVQDLNTTPIDKNSTTGFNQGALFTKIYSTLATTGQEGPAGSRDIDDIDEGWSGLFRVSWVLNEFPTDEGWWVWADPGVDQARVMGWDGENPLVECLYFRCLIDIKYCIHFLEYADDNLPQTAAQKAEVRFIRALNYWYLLDNFKYIPFIAKETTDPNDYPDFYSRKELFDWLEKELTELTTELPANRLGKYRVDQTAAWLLLSRLYLNAEVYTGEPKWKEAGDAADMAINGSYKLHEKSITNKDGIVYTPYQQLFMGDNDVNGAENEAVLLVYQDGYYCQSYGGVQYVIAATRAGGMVPWGCSANWQCFRSSPEFVYKFINQYEAENILADEYHMREYAKDDRAILCSHVDGNAAKWKLTGGMQNGGDAFYDSWACPKYTAVYSTADSLGQVLGSHSEWPDTDIPLMRIAEAYLNKAEAMFRQGDAGGAMTLINNSIRRRANATPLTSLDEATLCDEWCREFWGEGRRRTDLIRFNRFAGPQADANGYHWEGRGNSGNFKSVDEKYNWFPVPSDDKKTNPNFSAQVLNDKGKDMPGGDGYTYVTGE